MCENQSTHKQSLAWQDKPKTLTRHRPSSKNTSTCSSTVVLLSTITELPNQAQMLGPFMLSPADGSNLGPYSQLPARTDSLMPETC